MNSNGWLSNMGFSKMVQWFDTWRLSGGLLFGGFSKSVKYSEGRLISEVVQWVSKKKKAFVLKIVFIHGKLHV